MKSEICFSNTHFKQFLLNFKQLDFKKGAEQWIFGKIHMLSFSNFTTSKKLIKYIHEDIGNIYYLAFSCKDMYQLFVLIAVISVFLLLKIETNGRIGKSMDLLIKIP